MNLIKTNRLIVGAGVHGVILALHLLKERRVTPNSKDLVLVDSKPPMRGWFDATERQGITHLRTPNRVHPSTTWDDIALSSEFGTTRPWTSEAEIDQWLNQPASLSAFNTHAQKLIDDAQLERLRVPGHVTNVQPHDNGLYVHVLHGDGGYSVYDTQYCYVAPGLGKPIGLQNGMDHPNILQAANVDCNDLQSMESLRGHLCIIGGSLTAATLAVSIADYGHVTRITMCTRSSCTVSQLEADAGWIPGNALHLQFLAAPTTRRVDMLRSARVGRGITPDIWVRLQEHINAGTITLKEHTPVVYWGTDSNGSVVIPGAGLVDKVICAMGTTITLSDLPFLHSIHQTIEQANGLPVLSSTFESSVKGLRFLGRLAELQGGPLSRNIPGALYAARCCAAC